MKTVLMTGATGFLGSHIAIGLLDKGYRLLAYNRNKSDFAKLDKREHQIEWFNLDEASLETPFLKYSIDTVIHTATTYGRDGSIGAVVETNLLLPLQIFERCNQFGVRMFVNTDSFYNKADLQLSELNHFPNNYSLSKRQLLEWLRNFSGNVNLVNMKLQHIYGPCDNDDKFIPYIIKSCLNNVEYLNLTSGQQQRNFIYVKDVVNAYLAVVQNKNDNAFLEYEVGSSEVTTIRQVVELIKRSSCSNTELLFGMLHYRENENFDVSVDTSPLQSIGWQQEVLLETGIKEIINRIKSSNA